MLFVSVVLVDLVAWFTLFCWIACSYLYVGGLLLVVAVLLLFAVLIVYFVDCLIWFICVYYVGLLLIAFASCWVYGEFYLTCGFWFGHVDCLCLLCLCLVIWYALLCGDVSVY